MHIPENYLSPSTCAVMTAAMVPVWAYSVKRVKEEIPKSKIPLLGVGAAFSFLSMMFNVPLPGGTTGHAVAGTLIAILLASPYAACISVTIALLIQALFFGDGGILAFAANSFNMAFVLPFIGYSVYKFVKKIGGKDSIAAAIGGYIGINAAALCAAIEFGIQPLLFKDSLGQALYCPYPLNVSIPAMMVGHLTIFGLAELIFTVFVLVFIKKVSPGLIVEGRKKSFKPVAGLIAALIALVPLGLLAAGTAWGEWGTEEISEVISSGEKLGYVPKGLENGFNLSVFFPDYTMAGLPEWFGYILSALLGVAVCIIIFKLISAFMKDKPDFHIKSVS